MSWQVKHPSDRPSGTRSSVRNQKPRRRRRNATIIAAGTVLSLVGASTGLAAAAGPSNPAARIVRTLFGAGSGPSAAPGPVPTHTEVTSAPIAAMSPASASSGATCGAGSVQAVTSSVTRHYCKMSAGAPANPPTTGGAAASRSATSAKPPIGTSAAATQWILVDRLVRGQEPPPERGRAPPPEREAEQAPEARPRVATVGAGEARDPVVAAIGAAIKAPVAAVPAEVRGQPLRPLPRQAPLRSPRQRRARRPPPRQARAPRRPRLMRPVLETVVAEVAENRMVAARISSSS